MGAFILAESKQAPLSAHAYRAARSVIIFARNAVVVAVIFSIRPDWTGLLALPGLARARLNGIRPGLPLVSARFHDVPQIAASVVAFSPRKPEPLPGRALVPDATRTFRSWRRNPSPGSRFRASGRRRRRAPIAGGSRA